MDRYPALKLALLFGMGILTAYAVRVPIAFVALAGMALACCVTAVVVRRPWQETGVALLVVATGMVCQQVHAGLSCCPWEPGRRYVAVVDVAAEPRRTDGGWRFLARVRTETDGAVDRPRDFMVLARMADDPSWLPAYGDRAWVGGEFVLAPGQRNPGCFDYRAYLDHAEVAGILRIDGAGHLSAGNGNPLIGGVIIPARRHIRRVIAGHLSGDEAALLSGLALGERDGLSKAVLAAFSDTGTTHVLAVSGLHVVLAAFIIFMLLRLCQVPKRWAGGGTIAGLAFYTLVTGGAPSITRAAIMASCGILGELFERKGSGINSLGLAALLILSCWPQALADAGFQLSFAATLGILALTRPIQDRLFRLSGNKLVRDWLLLPLAVSLAAQVATAPVVAWHFHRVPLVSLAANLVIVPLTNLLLAIGLCMSLVGALSLAAVGPLAASAWGVSWLSLRSVELFAAVAVGTVPWPRPDLAQLALYGSVVGVTFGWRTLGRWRKPLLAAAVVAMALLAARSVLPRPAVLRVTFLDVGQGDAIFVEFPNGRRLLIDTGPAMRDYDTGERVIVPFLRARGITRIDDVLVTHCDADHSGGMSYLFSHVAAGRLMLSRAREEQPDYRRGAAAAAASGAVVDTVSGHDTLAGIAPCSGFVFGRADSAGHGNDASLVAVIRYGDHSFFFSGDMGPELEDTLLARGLLQRCTVLKAPHHGSRINSTPAIIGRLLPRYCVITVGEHNRFGHPSPEVVSGYRRAGAAVYRTDQCGAVIMETDGRVLRVRTMTDEGP
jgi:competence protein ComEC